MNYDFVLLIYQHQMDTKSTLVLLACSYLELISVHIYITCGSTCVTLSICAAAQTRAVLSPGHRS